jgi:HD-GYP domain-containing protein (c-di-GMP phosphodiesterase class II)
MMMGLLRALPPPGSPPLLRALQIARGLPKAVRRNDRHLAALCEVAQMLTDRLGMPASVRVLFAQLIERWDGKGFPGLARRDEIPLPLRIAHVARDAAFQRMVGGEEFAARVVLERAGGAFDPAIAGLLADEGAAIMAVDSAGSAWDETLAREPAPRLTLLGDAIDRALAAMGDFADLASPYLVGHSAGVAELVTAAAQRCHFPAADVVAARRAALVHDVGRVAVPFRIWQQASPLTPDEWERVRLHAYHSERVLCHSPFLAALAPVATSHHERVDGSGYHRGAAAAALTPPARLLAAADAYHAMTEPRPHREALSPERAAETLGPEARAGRLDGEAVAAVLEAAGHRAPRIPAARGADRARGRGHRPARAGLADQTDRAGARDLHQERPTATSRTPTPRLASRRVRRPRCSRCSTAWQCGENSRLAAPEAAHSVVFNAPGSTARCPSRGGGLPWPRSSPR